MMEYTMAAVFGMAMRAAVNASWSTARRFKRKVYSSLTEPLPPLARNNINASNNAATNIGTGTTNANVTIGGTANKVIAAGPVVSGGTTFTVASGTGSCATTTTLAGECKPAN